MSPHLKKLLLCTDLDRTLIPNGKAPESEGARQRFAQLVSQPNILLAYVSGRHRQLIEAAIHTYQLPVPDFAIADVGSTIYQIKQNHWQPLQAWRDAIAGDWQGMSREQLQLMLSDIGPLQAQEVEKQNSHKLSYSLPLEHEPQEIIHRMQARLQADGVKANIIWSIDELNKGGLLDILPAAANKLHAIRFLMQQMSFAETQTLFAGDSGNDLDVLLSTVPSVLVANADAEVRAAVTSAPADKLYLAHGNFLGMNGNYSAGIVEGVMHYHPELIPLIEGVCT